MNELNYTSASSWARGVLFSVTRTGSFNGRLFSPITLGCFMNISFIPSPAIRLLFLVILIPRLLLSLPLSNFSFIFFPYLYCPCRIRVDRLVSMVLTSPLFWSEPDFVLIVDNKLDDMKVCWSHQLSLPGTSCMAADYPHGFGHVPRQLGPCPSPDLVQ